MNTRTRWHGVREAFINVFCFYLLMKNSGQFQKGSIPWNKNPVLKSCLACEKTFYVSQSRNNDGRGKFCCFYCKKNYKYKLAQEFVLNKGLAELIGIIIGDGCISKVYDRDDYRIQISGNPIEDKEYYDSYLPSLISSFLGIKTKPYLGQNGAYIIQFQSEPFRIFLHKLGIISPKAKIVSIPQIIKKDQDLLLACIKGIADSDFTLIFKARKKGGLHYYPRICAQFASKNLVQDLEQELRALGFTLNCKYDYLRIDPRGFNYITNFINLDGPHNLERWFTLIGFSNSRILTRYYVWKKYGYLEPKSTIVERKRLLG
ncbi:MAG: hypothetical protein Q8R18_01270 [bacterium]|nr:hypothetical protein [bacterium]